MQNASLPEIQVATELNCQHCGWPLIKDGRLVCNRCGHERPVQSTLGRKRVLRCPKCWDPPVTLAVRDQAVCPKCGKRTPIIKEEEVVEKGVAEKLKKIETEIRRADTCGESLRKESDNLLEKTALALFNRQLQTLKERGCPQIAIDLLQYQQRDVITVVVKKIDILRVVEMRPFGEENILFLPVIPERFLSPFTQMEMVCHGEKKGICKLDVSWPGYEYSPSLSPYYIFNVGVTEEDFSPEGIFKKRYGREPVARLNVVEIIALAIHKDIDPQLSKAIDVAGEIYKCREQDKEQTPHLWIEGGQPVLEWKETKSYYTHNNMAFREKYLLVEDE